MIALSVALVVIACICGYLCNKYLDQRQQEIDNRNSINNNAAEAALSAATAELHKQFDDRINNTWSTISSVKEELNALRLQMGLRNINGR